MKSITVPHSDPEVPTSQAWPQWSDQEAEGLDTKEPRIVAELCPERDAPGQASSMWLPKLVHSLPDCTGQPPGETPRLCPKNCSAALSAQQPWEQCRGLASPPPSSHLSVPGQVGSEQLPERQRPNSPGAPEHWFCIPALPPTSKRKLPVFQSDVITARGQRTGEDAGRLPFPVGCL